MFPGKNPTHSEYILPWTRPAGFVGPGTSEIRRAKTIKSFMEIIVIRFDNDYWWGGEDWMVLLNYREWQPTIEQNPAPISWSSVSWHSSSPSECNVVCNVVREKSVLDVGYVLATCKAWKSKQHILWWHKGLKPISRTPSKFALSRRAVKFTISSKESCHLSPSPTQENHQTQIT